jgi:hypothetical protein
MAIMTLKKLYQEGRLSRGDTLTHSELGDYELIDVMADGQLVVKNAAGDTQVWKPDFGPDVKVVAVNN